MSAHESRDRRAGYTSVTPDIHTRFPLPPSEGAELRTRRCSRRLTVVVVCNKSPAVGRPPLFYLSSRHRSLLQLYAYAETNMEGAENH